MLNLRIDPELEILIRPLSAEEYDKLKASIFCSGILDPIKVWIDPEHPDCPTIIDGHNRYKIYYLYAGAEDPTLTVLPFKTKEEVKAWMKQFQRARRNLTEDQKLIEDLRDGVAPSISLATVKYNKAQALLKEAPELAEKVLSSSTYTVNMAFADLQKKKGTPPAKTAQAVPSPHPIKIRQRTHLVIGDTQVKPGVRTDHLRWIGQYIVDHFKERDLAVIHLGDHWDMPSLSSYDKGKRSMEGRRYLQDIEAGNRALETLTRPILNYNEDRRRPWKPELHFLLGNHEQRILRAAEDNAQLEGAVSLDHLNAKALGWTVHDFLQPLKLDGISYSHYFYGAGNGKPLGGEVSSRLKTLGHSFTQGHQQGCLYSLRPVGLKRQHGLVLGSTYLHDEEYLGPQVTAYWRGIVVCHQVEDGMYDPMFVSLDYLCRKYEGVPLDTFLADAKAA